MQLRARLAMSIAALALMAAGPTVGPADLDLEAGPVGGAPDGWGLAPASRAAGYDAVLTADAPQSGKASARLVRSHTDVANGPGFGSLSQAIDATAYRGHRIRFRAAVRAHPANGWAGLWLRVDRPGGRPGFFENMQNRPVTSADWTFHEIEGVVAPDASMILFGLLLAGDGEAGIDTASLEDLGPIDPASQSVAKAYLDEALDRLQREHINTAKVDWKALRAEAALTASGATTPAQTYPAIRGVIIALGERHTFLSPPQSRTMPGAPTSEAPAPSAPGRIPPHGAMVGERVAMVVLPSLLRNLADPQDDGMPYQTAIETFVNQARGDGACGWIIDLRGHGGGDMWPGMRGLAGVLGAGPHGVFVNAKANTRWPRLPLTVAPSEAPVAVLIGPRTGSSGEMIAIAFEGRPATRFFGEATAGLTTANAARPLSDGAVLAVTSAYVEDRTGRRYDGPVQPDEAAPGPEAEAKALAWLKAQGCR